MSCGLFARRRRGMSDLFHQSPEVQFILQDSLHGLMSSSFDINKREHK